MSAKRPTVIPSLKAAQCGWRPTARTGVIMADAYSAVLEYSAPEPAETAAVMAEKLRFHTDSWDLSVDLKSGHPDIVVIDARSRSIRRAPRTRS